MRLHLIGGPDDGRSVLTPAGVRWFETSVAGTLRIAVYEVVDCLGLYRKTRLRLIW